MILLDTNVLIYAFEPESRFHQLGRETIVDAVAGEGAAINAVSLAEICVAQFEQTDNKDEKLSKLIATNSWQRGAYVSKQGWATMPGSDSSTSQVAAECAARLASEYLRAIARRAFELGSDRRRAEVEGRPLAIVETRRDRCTGRRATAVLAEELGGRCRVERFDADLDAATPLPIDPLLALYDAD